MAKAVTTQQLREAHVEADRRDYNRRLNDEALQDLDENGVHIFSLMLIHEHAAFQPVEPHARCFALLKMTGETKPLQTYLDIPFEHYNEWADAKDQADYPVEA